MDETIDLRPYVAALIRYVWLIGLVAILAIMLSIVIYYLGNDYEATALVTVPEPTQQLQFDPRITTRIQTNQLLTAYPRLALSDELLSRLLPQAQEITGGKIATLSDMRDALNVVSSPDVRIVYLMVKNGDPQAAAQLVNAWADEFVVTVDNVYGRNGTDFFTDQMSQASVELQIAEEALVTFQTTNRQMIVDNELSALTDLQMSYLTQQNAYRLALDNIQSLRVQLEHQATDNVPLADQLTALAVQLQAYQNISLTATLPSFQLNIEPNALLTTTGRAEQLQRLEALRASIESAMAVGETQLAQLEPQLFALQTEKQRLFNEGQRLIRQRDIAQETFATLARKVDEERVASQETMARLASYAAVPEKPERPNLIVLLPLFAIAALLLCTGVIILRTWWLTGRPVANRVGA